jgi:hypothetical protein
MTKLYSSGTEIKYLIWDIRFVTCNDIIKFWQKLGLPNTFHDQKENSLTNKDCVKIRSLLTFHSLNLKITVALNNIMNKNISLSDFLTKQDRLILHLVSKTTGYKSVTEKIPKIIEVSCNTIGHYGSLPLATEHHIFTTFEIGFKCGCRYVPNILKEKYDSYSDPKGVCWHDTLWYEVPTNIPVAIHLKNLNHQQYVVKDILDDGNIFPGEINQHIVSYLN